MRLQVLFDERGKIIATSELADGPNDVHSEIIPEPNQSFAELDVPAQYQKLTPLQRHEQLRVNLSGDRPMLVKRDGGAEPDGHL